MLVLPRRRELNNMADTAESHQIGYNGSTSIESRSYVQPAEDPYKKSICYLERHNILELFKNLTSDVIYNRPSDPLDFLIKEVQQLMQDKDQSAVESS